MGVRSLWTILNPIEEHVPLRSLGGKKLAIDLSGWICGDMKINEKAHTRLKLYIRNLIFRVIALLRESVTPVAVTDGDAPTLKAEILEIRQNGWKKKGCRNSKGATHPPISLQRRYFTRISNQCCRLLNALGLPCVRSPGEAEAMCAFLDSSGLVDGCVTSDGDSFLYGASTVYRHFTLNCSGASVLLYDAKRIESDLGLSRNQLIILALIMGCDFWPSGVPGVGAVSARAFLAQVDLQSFMDHLRTPPTNDVAVVADAGNGHQKKHKKAFSDCVWQSVSWEKISRGLSLCPVDEVLKEFLLPCLERGWSMPSKESLTWMQPQVKTAVELCMQYLDWQPTYALAQFVPLLALWIMRERALSSDSIPVHFLEPIRLLRKRTLNYVPSYEVEWKRLDCDVWSESALSDSTPGPLAMACLSTFFTEHGYKFAVPAREFQIAFPELVSVFESLRMRTLQIQLDELSINDKLSSRSKSKGKKAFKASQKLMVGKTISRQGTPFSGPLPTSTRIKTDLCLVNKGYLPNWDTTPEVTPNRSSVSKSAYELPSPLSDQSLADYKRCSKLDDSTVFPFISVQLNTAFERRRLALESSLLSVCGSPEQTGRLSDEFSVFRTPVRLFDRVRLN